MPVDWNALARLILALSRAALQWYVVVNGVVDDEQTNKARKAVATVLDPDTDADDPDDVVFFGDRW